MGIGPAAAFAHPSVSGAAPAPGLIAPRSPDAIVISLSEPAAPRGSSISLTAPNGARVLLGKVRAGAGGRTLSAGVPSGGLRSAVYAVRWRALGEDGHVVSGGWSFGVAGADGKAPPGAAALEGAAGGTRGDSQAGLEGPLRVGMRWLGIVAAAFLLGGRLLARRDGTYAERWRRLAPRAWAAVVVAAFTDALTVAATGAGGFDTSLLTASASGKVALVRLLLVALLTLLAAFPSRFLAWTVGAAGVLTTYALEGHALSSGSGLTTAFQIAHSLSAGIWLGGLLLLALAARGAEPGALRAGARAFAPLAAVAFAISVGTGLPVAFREVGDWYFLRWSDYGRVVILKAGFVLLVGLAGAVTWWLARRGRIRARLLRGEAVLLAAVVALAAVLGGLAQGRGQPLPAERGTLLPGPAFATAVARAGSTRLTLAPARKGANVVTVEGKASRLDLSCPACRGAPRRTLALSRRAPGAPLWASVDLPSDGNWYATIPGASPVLLRSGVPEAPGAPPVNVLAVADLSGPDGVRCRSHLLGLELAISRLNASGGLDGGRKVAPLVLDDGGDPARAAALASRALGDGDKPVALVPCGGASGPALEAASKAGVPSIVGDPGVPVLPTARTFRLAADPRADGFALGRYVAGSIAPGARAKTVRVLPAADAQGARRLSGLREGLRGSGLHLTQMSREDLRAPSLAAVLNPRHTTALIADVPLAAALRTLGTGRLGIPVAPVLASERVLTEDLVTGAGAIGRVGAVQGTSSVGTQSRDAIAYSGALPVLYQGERPTLDGLRGYVAGLALREGVRDGTGAASIARRLTRPAPFTDALVAPWRSDLPAAGSQRLALIRPNFLPAQLIPTSAGGETYEGRYFSDGTWAPLGSQLYGPSLRVPLPPLP
jgi:putative copper export protein/methionine-rich copper-binding protein CopC